MLDAIIELNPEPIARRTVTQCVLMLTTGLRISECLALNLEHLAVGGEVGEWLYLPRYANKCQLMGHTLPLCGYTRETVRRWIDFAKLGDQPPGTPLFPRLRQYTHQVLYGTRISGEVTRHLLQRAVAHARLSGKVTSHGFRKTYAARIYELTGKNPLAVKSALRHISLASTMQYLDDHRQAAQAAAFNFFD